MMQRGGMCSSSVLICFLITFSLEMQIFAKLCKVSGEHDSILRDWMTPRDVIVSLRTLLPAIKIAAFCAIPEFLRVS